MSKLRAIYRVCDDAEPQDLAVYGLYTTIAEAMSEVKVLMYNDETQNFLVQRLVSKDWEVVYKTPMSRYWLTGG